MTYLGAAPAARPAQPDVFRAYFAAQLASGGALIVLDARTGETIRLSRYHGYDAERSAVEIGPRTGAEGQPSVAYRITRRRPR